MSRFWKIAGITAVVAMLVVASVAVVSAQGPATGNGNRAGGLWQRMHEGIAKALGITVAQYDKAVDTARDDVLKQAVQEGLLTQEQADRIREQDGFGPWGVMRGGMFGGCGFGMGGSGNSLISVAAEKLDMTVEQLLNELEGDKTIADVVKAKGVELKTIVDAFLAPRAEYLTALVADGRITQQQANAMLEHMREQAQEHLEESYPFRCDPDECGEHMEENGFGGMFRGGPGMMGQRSF